VIIIDDEAIQCGSENWGSTGNPENESFGNRGWQVRITSTTSNHDIVDDYVEIFDELVDPDNHKDVVRYANADYQNDEGREKYKYEPGYDTCYTTESTNSDYKLVKTSIPVIQEEMTITAIFSPDNSLDEVNGPIAMINSATSEILIQQANLKKYWYGLNDSYTTQVTENGVTYDRFDYPNFPLQAVINKAVNNPEIDVKIIADDAFFNVQPDDPRNNEETKDYLNGLGLDNLSCVLFHDPLRGNESSGPITKTHNKGVIVDGSKVLVCSINWVENSFKGNRESGVIIENDNVAAFFRDVFLNDWYGPLLPDTNTEEPEIIAEGGKIKPALVITEVMANAVNEDQDEYIEIFNDSKDSIDVYNFIITDGDATDYLIALSGYGAQSTTVIPSGGYAIIHDSEYTGYYDASIPSGAIRLTCKNTTIGNELQTTDPITLKDANGLVIDSWTSPFNPGNGVSAEAKADGTFVTGPTGGTPGAANQNNKP
jgi:hypothetical protein